MVEVRTFEELEGLRRKGYCFRDIWKSLLESPKLLSLLKGNPENIVDIFPHWKEQFVLLQPIKDLDGLFLFLQEWFELSEEVMQVVYPVELPSWLPPPLQKIYRHFHLFVPEKNPGLYYFQDPPPAFLLSKGRPVVFSEHPQNSLIAPERLELEAGRDQFAFLVENQGVWYCETLKNETDPSVYQVINDEPFDERELVSESLEQFLVTYLLSEVSYYLKTRLDEKKKTIYSFSRVVRSQASIEIEEIELPDYCKSQKVWRGNCPHLVDRTFYRVNTDYLVWDGKIDRIPGG